MIFSLVSALALLVATAVGHLAATDREGPIAQLPGIGRFGVFLIVAGAGNQFLQALAVWFFGYGISFYEPVNSMIGLVAALVALAIAVRTYVVVGAPTNDLVSRLTGGRGLRLPTTTRGVGGRLCRNCQRTIADSSLFCEHCGASQGAAAV
jgi:hypothetical protein